MNNEWQGSYLSTSYKSWIQTQRYKLCQLNQLSLKPVNWHSHNPMTWQNISSRKGQLYLWLGIYFNGYINIIIIMVGIVIDL